jgi:hypothetical protein
MSFPLVHYLSCVVHAFLPTPPVKETGKTSCMTSARSVVRLYWGVGWGFTPVVRKTKLKKCVAPAKSAHRKGTLSKTWKSPRVFPGCSRASDLFAKRSSSQWMDLSHRAAGPIFTFLPRMQSNFHQIALQPLIRPTRRVQVVATSILQRVRRLLLAATTCCAYWLLSGLLDLFERPLVTDGTSEEGEDSKEE